MKTPYLNKKVASKFASKLTCIIALAAIVALASPVSLAAQEAGQKPLVLIFTATFAPIVGFGPSMQYEFQADSILPATTVAMAWGEEYCPQNVLVSLVPKSLAPQETITATFAPKVGLGPSMMYQFQLAEKPPILGDRFLQTVRAALAWGKEYCPQNILVALLPESQYPQGASSTQDALSPMVRANPQGLPAQSQPVFTAKFVSRDSGLVMQKEVQSDTLLRAAGATLAWGKIHCPEFVLYSLVQN